MTDKITRLDDHRKPPQAPAAMMLQITVYGDGDGTLWLSDSVTHKEQFNWAAAKVAEVVGALLAEKAQRSGEL